MSRYLRCSSESERSYLVLLFSITIKGTVLYHPYI
jgi:hypothetical protein